MPKLVLLLAPFLRGRSKHASLAFPTSPLIVYLLIIDITFRPDIIWVIGLYIHEKRHNVPGTVENYRFLDFAIFPPFNNS